MLAGFGRSFYNLGLTKPHGGRLFLAGSFRTGLNSKDFGFWILDFGLNGRRPRSWLAIAI